jgi:Ca2+/H+ antiporter, TMEM165/GDT1 family
LVEAFLSTFGLVFLAELGDKSMLFSLSAATRYRWWMVLLPIAVATALLNGLAVIAGGIAGDLLPEAVVAVAAGALFIAFGLWTLRGDDEDDEDVSTAYLSPWRVMLALGLVFFLAEFGDKTQIATMALAGLHGGGAIVAVWLGATLGMVGTNALAVFAGRRLERYLPPRVVRLAAAGVFIAFGVLSLVLAFV